jgi:hypothetical protein
MNEKPTRIRKKSLRIQLELALRDAEACMTATPNDELAIAKMKLSQTRLLILNKMLAREQNHKARRNAADLVTLRAENERLRSQHEQDTAEMERIRAACRLGQHTSFDDIASRVSV